MNNVYQKEFQLPYEKREVLTWITKHHRHNIQNLTSDDEAWINEIFLGFETAKLQHLVEYNLTPSVWFDVILTKTSFTEERVYEWLERHYECLVFNVWVDWVKNTATEFISELGNEWPTLFTNWARDVAENYNKLSSEQYDGAIPPILTKNSPTRKIVFGLKDADIERLPNMYNATKQVDNEFITQMQSEAYCA